MAELETGTLNSRHPVLGNNTGVANNGVANTGGGVGAYGHGGRTSRIANPSALGWFSFASTLFMFSLYNLNTRNINTANVIVGMALFAGGLAQLLAGMWEFPRGHTLAATVFTSYGVFWMAFATILIPGSGILSAYASQGELASALGIFFIAWALVSFFFLIASLRRNISSIAIFFFLTLTFILLAASQFTNKRSVAKAAGATGIITTFIAFYAGLSELLASESASVVQFPLGNLQKRGV